MSTSMTLTEQIARVDAAAQRTITACDHVMELVSPEAEQAARERLNANMEDLAAIRAELRRVLGVEES